jgi:hypothetical protein
MDGQLLCQSLFALKGDDLRIIFALLCKTNINNVLSSKTRDLLSIDEQDHLRKHLLQVIKTLEDISDDKLRFYLYLEITKVLGIKGVRYTSEEQIELQASKIIEETHKLLEQQEKDFIQVKRLNDTKKLQQLLIYQVDKLLNNLLKIQGNVSQEIMLDITTNLVQYINVLSAEKQEQIKKQWAVPTIDIDSVNVIITRSDLTSVLNVLKRIEGFTFYIHLAPNVITFLNQNQKWDTTLNGKWVIDPSNISNLIGLSDILLRMNQSDFHKRLLPIIITQICLLYLCSDEELVIDTNVFINEWKDRLHKYVKFKESISEIESRQGTVRNEIRIKTNFLSQLENNIAECMKNIEIGQKSILSALQSIDLNTLTINRSFHEHKQEFNERKNNIAAIKKARTASTDEGSIFKKVSSSFANFYRGFNLTEEEKKFDLLLNKMVDDVIDSSSSFCQNEREKINYLSKLLTELNEEKSSEEARKLNLENKLNLISKEYFTLNQTIISYEKENYGLKDITLSSEDFLELEQVKVEEKKKQIKQNESYLKKKQLFINNYEYKMNDFVLQNKELHEKLADKELKINSLQQQAKSMEEEIGKLNIYKMLAKEIEWEKRDLINQKNQLIGDNEKEKKRQLNEQNANWENKLQDVKVAAEKYNKQLLLGIQEWQAKYDKLEMDSRNKHQILESEKKQLQREKNSIKEALDTLHQKFKYSEDNDRLFKNRKNELDHEIGNLKERINKAVIEKEKLNSKYQIKMKEKENLFNQQINEFKLESESKLNQLTNYYKEQQEYLTNNLNQSWQKKQEKLINKYEEEIEKKSNTIHQLQSEKQLLEQKCDELNRSLNEKNEKQLEQEWNRKLNALREKYETKINELTKKVEKLKSSQVNLKEDIDDFDRISFEDLPFTDLFVDDQEKPQGKRHR